MRMRTHNSAGCLRTPRRLKRLRGLAIFASLLTLILFSPFAQSAVGQVDETARTNPPNTNPDANQPQVLDHVVAVVNNQVILASDIALEMRVFRLLPIGDGSDATPPKSLERLTTRTLIEQQIVQEDPHGLEITPADLQAGLAELRQNLPACKHRDCTTASGWSAYLATLGLTPANVSEYWSHRMAVLRFIEQRFRSGVRIAPEEIQKYYRETLVPRYADPQDAPPLDRISPRIQEILLQQQVNTLLNDWLKSLQDQGQVEVLDPALAMPKTPAPVESAPLPETQSPRPHSPGNGGLL